MAGVLGPIGAGLGAGGSIMSGFAQANAAKYQATVASNNALIAEQNAQYAAGAGATQVENQELKEAQQQAGVRAGLAADGVDVNSGSAAKVQTSQREIGALDTSAVASHAAETVYGYRTQAQSYDAQSALDKAEVPGDIIGGFLKGGSIIGSAAPNLPTGWMGGNPKGALAGDITPSNGDFEASLGES